MSQITLEEIAKILGVEVTEETTKDQFRTKFNEIFVAKNIAHEMEDIKSKVVGEDFKMLRRDFEKSGFIDQAAMKGEDDKWLHPRDIFKKIADKATNQIDDIKKKSTEGADKRIQDLQREVDEKQKSLADYIGLNDKLKAENQTLSEDFTKKLSQAKSQFLMKDLTGQFTYADEVNQFTKNGFEDHMKSNYQFVIKSEEGKPDALEIKKDGHYIPSPADATKFATPAEIWRMEMEKAKLLKVSGKSEKKPVNLPKGSGEEDDNKVNYIRKPLSESDNFISQ